jgi:hypothetical protein
MDDEEVILEIRGMTTMKVFVIILLVICAALFVTGCFPHQSSEIRSDPPGFFMGVWHGWIAPLSLIVSLFDSDVRIYQANNSGWWYDFGFYVAVIAGFGGVALSRRKTDAHHPNR